MFLNPDTSKFDILFSADFFPEFLTNKYNNYLSQLNMPINDIQTCILESVQSVTVPGYSMQSLIISGLNNLGRKNGTTNSDLSTVTTNIQVPSFNSLFEILTDTKLTISMRNNMYNWMYCFEFFRKFYKMRREVSEFDIITTLKDTNNIDIFRFIFRRCFITELPELELSYVSLAGETKLINIGISFSQFDCEFLIPSYNTTTKIIK